MRKSVQLGAWILAAVVIIQICTHSLHSSASEGTQFFHEGPKRCPIVESHRKRVWSASGDDGSQTQYIAGLESCKTRQLGGDQGNKYAGWTVCETPELLGSRKVEKPAIIYSFGLGTDTSFDEAIIAKYGVIVHGFDPTPGSVRYVRTRSSQLPSCYFGHHPFGINDKDGEIELYPPENPQHISHTQIPRAGVVPVQATLLKLSTIMQLLAHNHVHILKLDVEGAEYSILASLLHLPPPSQSGMGADLMDSWGASPGKPAARIPLPFDQLCVEFHPANHPGGEAAAAAALSQITRALGVQGFQLVHDTGINELTFARMHRSKRPV